MGGAYTRIRPPVESAAPRSNVNSARLPAVSGSLLIRPPKVALVSAEPARERLGATSARQAPSTHNNANTAGKSAGWGAQGQSQCDGTARKQQYRRERRPGFQSD